MSKQKTKGWETYDPVVMPVTAMYVAECAKLKELLRIYGGAHIKTKAQWKKVRELDNLRFPETEAQEAFQMSEIVRTHVANKVVDTKFLLSWCAEVGKLCCTPFARDIYRDLYKFLQETAKRENQ